MIRLIRDYYYYYYRMIWSSIRLECEKRNIYDSKILSFPSHSNFASLFSRKLTELKNSMGKYRNIEDTNEIIMIYVSCQRSKKKEKKIIKKMYLYKNVHCFVTILFLWIGFRWGERDWIFICDCAARTRWWRNVD